MGTTTNGLPYPEGSDPFGEGAQAIEALAEAVDPHVGLSRFADSFTNLGQDIANTNTDIVMGFNTTGHTLTSDWTWSSANNRWTYSGPDALFSVVLQVVFNVAAVKGRLSAYLRADAATALWGGSMSVQDFGSNRFAINAAGIIHMGPTGFDTLDVRVKSNLDTPAANAAIDGGDFGGNRIYGVKVANL